MTDDKKYAKLWFFVAASIDKWDATSAKIRVLSTVLTKFEFVKRVPFFIVFIKQKYCDGHLSRKK